MNNTCPVCGYDKMRRPPEDDYICPCCGTHFGLDDYFHSHLELREKWINSGPAWFSDWTPMPARWNATAQLRKIGCDLNRHDHLLVSGYSAGRQKIILVDARPGQGFVAGITVLIKDDYDLEISLGTQQATAKRVEIDFATFGRIYS